VWLFIVLVRTFLLSKSQDEISFTGAGGGGCDTSYITIAAIVFYNTCIV
jgi:hypothetical protein